MKHFILVGDDRYFDFENPQPSQIHIEDIVRGLFNQNRFNGQSPLTINVGQHSLAVYDAVCDLTDCHTARKQALLHDAHEAYTGDIVRPLKKLIGDAIYDIEHRLDKAIGDKFGVDLTNLDPIVKQADNDIYLTEIEVYWPGRQLHIGMVDEKTVDKSYVQRRARATPDDFMAVFNQLFHVKQLIKFPEFNYA